ncbi:hypothetical protein [Cupriavidus basilensis]|uniref:hypothetical protein n=1 Tax=Cupriavidus basilensis TaxID=68895 RepID=UPI001147A392|nr:hypothetical protein [Cupriavidus basilensis]
MPQGTGSYIPFWTDDDRTLDFSLTPERINGNVVHVIDAHAWHEPHSLPPGMVDHVDGERFVVSRTGGFVAIPEWNLLPPGQMRGTAPR